MIRVPDFGLLLVIYGFYQAFVYCDLPRDDGGWITAHDKLLAYPGPCTIEARDSSLTQEEFLHRYAFQAPVVIRGITSNQAFQNQFRKENLLLNYGNLKIRLSSANTYSYEKKDVTVHHYVNNMVKPQTLEMLGNETYIWFGNNNYTEWDDLIKTYNPPVYRLPSMTGAYSFGLAGAGTGVPFHFHGPGFAEVVFGRKRWFFYAPEKTPLFHPNRTTLQWLIEDYPNLHPSNRPLECTMNPGELIYFPNNWWHGTLNIDTSVFISTFLSP